MAGQHSYGVLKKVSPVMKKSSWGHKCMIILVRYIGHIDHDKGLKPLKVPK